MQADEGVRRGYSSPKTNKRSGTRTLTVVLPPLQGDEHGLAQCVQLFVLSLHRINVGSRCMRALCGLVKGSNLHELKLKVRHKRKRALLFCQPRVGADGRADF